MSELYPFCGWWPFCLFNFEIPGRNFSCLKGVDVIPCQGEDELEDDPEVGKISEFHLILFNVNSLFDLVRRDKLN